MPAHPADGIRYDQVDMRTLIDCIGSEMRAGARTGIISRELSKDVYNYQIQYFNFISARMILECICSAASQDFFETSL